MLPKVFKILQIVSNISKLKDISAIVIVVISCLQSSAQGNLLVTPKRIVFEGAARSEEINLANTGKDSATYDISFIQIRMNEDGTVEKVTEPDSAQNFADTYLRYFPRTVTLAPNEAQTVKVQIRRSDEMKPGEYRSHLYLRAVPNEKPLGEKKEVSKDSGISVKLIPIFGISIPVIIRVGEHDVQVKLTDLQVISKDSIPTLQITFNRTGNMSVYGDINVNYISPKGKIIKVGLAKGIAVYTPNKLRHFNISLNKNADVNYHSGKLQIVYSDQAAKNNNLSEEYITLN